MNKRGSAIFVVGFFVLLFALFLVLKSFGFGSVTGHVVGATCVNDSNCSAGEVCTNSSCVLVPVSNNFSLENIYFFRLNVINESYFEIVTEPSDDNRAENEFGINDTVGCVLEYDSISGSPNVSVGFYSEENDMDDPNKIYLDIFNDDLDNSLCEDSTCLVYYVIEDYELGNWNCFASWDGDSEVSDEMIMDNRPPIFLGNLSMVRINVDGSYVNGSLDLDDYFVDLEGDEMEYGAVGQLYIDIAVGSNGVVNFLNPNSWEGSEHVLFRAHDGNSGIFSNNVTILVGSGVASMPEVCNPAWDCSWGDCVGGQQRCVYSDRNSCGSSTGKPSDLTRTCVVSTSSASSGAGLSQSDLSSFSEDVSSVSGIGRTLLVIGLVILILVVLGIGGYLLLQYKGKDKAPLIKQEPKKDVSEVKTEHSKELNDYIEKALGQKQPEQKIKDDLVKAGWHKEDVNSSFGYIKIKLYVKEKLNSGFDKAKLIESLKAKGWKDNVIDNLFKELGK